MFTSRMRGPTQHLWINYDDQMVTLWLHLHTEIGFPPQSTHSEELVHFYWERIFCNFHRILKLEMSELSFWCYSVGFFSEFQPLFSFTALPASVLQAWMFPVCSAVVANPSSPTSQSPFPQTRLHICIVHLQSQ